MARFEDLANEENLNLLRNKDEDVSSDKYTYKIPDWMMSVINPLASTLGDKETEDSIEESAVSPIDLIGIKPKIPTSLGEAALQLGKAGVQQFKNILKKNTRQTLMNEARTGEFSDENENNLIEDNKNNKPLATLSDALSPETKMKMQSIAKKSEDKKLSNSNPVDLLALNSLKWQNEFGGSSVKPTKEQELDYALNELKKPELNSNLVDLASSSEEPREPSDISTEIPKIKSEKKSSVIDSIIPSASAESMPDIPPSAKPRIEELKKPEEIKDPEEIQEPEEQGFTEATVENLKKAQEQAKKDRAEARLLRSVALMRSGALGSKYKVSPPDISGAEEMSKDAQEEADRPLKDLQARIDMEKSDPKSVRSVNARSMFRTMLKNANLDLKIPDNMSEEDLVKRYPIVEKLIKNKEDSELKKEEIHLRGVERLQLQKEKTELAIRQLEEQSKNQALAREDRARAQQNADMLKMVLMGQQKELAFARIQAADERIQDRDANRAVLGASKSLQTAGGARGNTLRRNYDQTIKLFSTAQLNENISRDDLTKTKAKAFDKYSLFDITEMAIELNKILSESGVPAQATLQKLIPVNLETDAAKLEQYAKSKDVPAGQGERVKKMLEIAARVRDYVKAENTKLQQEQLVALDIVKQRKPEVYQNLLATHKLMDVEEYLEYMNSQEYKELTKTPPGTIITMKDGKKYKVDKDGDTLIPVK